MKYKQKNLIFICLYLQKSSCLLTTSTSCPYVDGGSCRSPFHWTRLAPLPSGPFSSPFASLQGRLAISVHLPCPAPFLFRFTAVSSFVVPLSLEKSVGYFCPPHSSPLPSPSLSTRVAICCFFSFLPCLEDGLAISAHLPLLLHPFCSQIQRRCGRPF